jgi:Flp pilus assembly pilin Flp
MDMLQFTQRFLKNKRGAALVEYALIVAGVALIAAASVATFGHKTNDMIAMVAATLPGAHAGDNAPIASGKIIETVEGTATTPIALDFATIATNSDGTLDRISLNLGASDGTTANPLVVEP